MPLKKRIHKVHLAPLALMAVAVSLPAQTASDQDPLALEEITITARREHRVSTGATHLPLTIKETPQSISVIDQDAMRDFATTGTNDALRLGTGLTVDEWETNRTTFSARGFDIMLTQIDGLGTTNDWGLVVGQSDTYLFDRIELIRGANGLLTGVGNASGTINYVRKRPTNRDGGEIVAAAGSHDLRRVALDYNKVLTASGSWAARLVLAHEDKDSHLRALHDRRTSLYGVVDGQVGSAGSFTAGLTFTDSLQRSPMWGSLTLMRTDGTQAEFDASASTSQDWTRWALRSLNGFVEYEHSFSGDWHARVTYSHRVGEEAVKLLYAYSFSGALNPDGTGLLAWPYRSDLEARSDIVDANSRGRFEAFGRHHEAIAGLSLSWQQSSSEYYAVVSAPGAELPAFPYAGDVYAEPTWGATTVGNDGDQRLARLYAALRLGLTDRLKGIAGLNAIRLERDGTAIYGGGTQLDNETITKASPYAGLTYDLTADILAYASYSDIFQAQDQRDINGRFLAPMKGENIELGLKAEWLQRRLLTVLALFDARQLGIATQAGFDPVAQQYYYAPQDVKSRGFELEAAGRVGPANLAAGFTRMELTGPDGRDIYTWVPRTIIHLRADTRMPMLPRLKVGAGMRWQSDIYRPGAVRQDAYVLIHGFAAVSVTEAATLRLTIDNITDEKYLRTVQYGAIYGAPRRFSVSFDYRF